VRSSGSNSFELTSVSTTATRAYSPDATYFAPTSSANTAPGHPPLFTSKPGVPSMPALFMIADAVLGSMWSGV
jgi:hypothetical protein